MVVLGILGSEFTEFLYKNGANLILGDIISKKFKTLKKKYPKALFLKCDVTKEKILKI